MKGYQLNLLNPGIKPLPMLRLNTILETTMTELEILELFSIGALSTIGLLNWKTGLAEALINKFVNVATDAGSWLISKEGAYSSLPEQLPYWDFYQDFVLTKNGWLWSAVEIKTISTGGFDANDWKMLGDRLNRVYTSLPEGTWVQVIHTIDNDPTNPSKVFEKLAKKTTNSPLYPLVISRAKQMKMLAQIGILRDSKVYVFIGRKRKETITKVPISSMFSGKKFNKIEQEDFQELQQEVLRVRDTFMYTYQNCGGQCRPVTAKVAFQVAYQKLNPERSRNLSAPDYIPVDVQRPKTKAYSNKTKGVKVELNSLREELFADNPRETLCFTSAEVIDWFIKFDDVFIGNISLYKLPVRIFVGLMGWLTQAPELNFKVSISSSFQIGQFNEVDEQLERMLSWRRRNIRVAKDDANQDEELQALEIAAVREDLRKGEEKIGRLGLQISFEAESKAKLKEYRDTILSLMKRLEGLEGCAEAHDPFSLYLAGLPAGVENDFRDKLCLTRDAIALTPFTGCSSGVAMAEATHVFTTVEGRPLYWDAYPSSFNNGTIITIGPPGSGKSSLFNLLRSVNHLSGRRLVTLDFGGSATRLCLALNGNYIDVTDPAKTNGLGIFNIRPLKDEEYSASELTEDGLPLDKLASLEKTVELLCLDPNNAQEVGLGPVKVAILRRYIRETYANLGDEVPTVDNLIFTLENAHPDDREISLELASRLSIYAQNSSLGKFLNDQGDPLPIDSPYTVFDFRGTIDDPRLMLIATMAVTNYINRFLRVNSKIRKVEKCIDVDEFRVISRYLPVLQLIELIWRTARKANAVCMLASQSPGDFHTNELARGIKENSEVFFLFPGADPNYVAEKIGLSEGEKEDFSHLQIGGKDYRECLLIHPTSGIKRACARLRLDLSPLDGRVMLGAGREKVTLKQAVADVPREQMKESFYQALVSDPLGVDVGKNKTKQEEFVYAG